jgi:hypothetical protein
MKKCDENIDILNIFNIIDLQKKTKNVFVVVKHLGGNSQNVLFKFVVFVLTLRCFFGVVIQGK